MINIILGILIVNQIFHIVVKPHIVTLNCGLWGFFGNINKFDINKFNILGINNQSRGGDAIGIATPNKIVHDIKSKNYSDFLTSNKISISKKIKYVAGHVRKSSDYMNRNMIEYSQPILDWNEDYSKINYIFSHNGTITEYLKLHNLFLKDAAKTFSYLNTQTGDITINSINDSYVLFQALMFKKYDILANYTGSAAFSFYDVNENLLYLFSGKSKTNAFYDISSIERPLYYSVHKDYLWYSSTEEGLKIIENSPNILEVVPNTLMIFKDAVLQESINIDRTAIKVSAFHYDEYKYFGVQKFMAAKPQLNLPATFTNNENYDLNSEVFLVPNNYFIAYVKGRYWFKNKLMNGIFHISEYGLIENTKLYLPPDGTIKPYYFVDGVMIKDAIAYNELTRFLKKIGTIERLNHNIFKVICEHSVYPIHKTYDTDNIVKFWTYSEKRKFCSLYTGELYPLFCSRKYIITYGEITRKVELTTVTKADHKLKIIDITKDKTEILGLDISKYCTSCGEVLTTDNSLFVDTKCILCKEFDEYDKQHLPEEDDADDIVEELSEAKVLEKINEIDLALMELRSDLIGEVSPYFKKTAEVVEEMRDALIDLENWSWEN